MISTLPNETGFSNLYLSCHSKQRGRVGPASFTDPILMTSRTMGISGLSLTLTSLCHLLPNHLMFLVILRDSVLHFSGHTHLLRHIMQSYGFKYRLYVRSQKCISTQICCGIPGSLSNCLVGNPLQHLTEIPKCL